MKRNILLLFFSLCLCIAFGQYVQKPAGVKWGANEELYSNYGNRVLNNIQNESYLSAVELLKKMISTNCKNADRLKDYYTLAYCYNMMGESYYDELISACAEYMDLRSKGVGGSSSNSNDIYILQSLGMAAYDGKEEYKTAATFFENALKISSKVEDKSWNEYMIGRCYHAMNNKIMASSFFKNAIQDCCKMYNTSIAQVESRGGDYFLLGNTFYQYAKCVEYQDWLYLIYLSAKCGYSEGVEEANKMGLLRIKPDFHPSKDLF